MPHKMSIGARFAAVKDRMKKRSAYGNARASAVSAAISKHRYGSKK